MILDLLGVGPQPLALGPGGFKSPFLGGQGE